MVFTLGTIHSPVSALLLTLSVLNTAQEEDAFPERGLAAEDGGAGTAACRPWSAVLFGS